MSKLNKSLLALVLASAVAMGGCAGKETGNVSKLDGYKYEQELNVIDDKNRTYYEIFVYSFYDSNSDGIGDLNGVTEKLDYIQDLGFNGIWLMPIMPSPTYHTFHWSSPAFSPLLPFTPCPPPHTPAPLTLSPPPAYPHIALSPRPPHPPSHLSTAALPTHTVSNTRLHTYIHY